MTLPFYVFPKLDVKKFNITNDKQFAHDLLDATNILLVPGSGFDWKIRIISVSSCFRRQMS